MDPIVVADGDVLTVTADAGSYGTVFAQDGGQWTVSAKSPLRLGPGRYRVETVKGTVTHSLDSQAVAALKATLPRATEIVSTAANIATGIRTDMLSDKFKRLADRAKAVPAKLGERADAALARLDAVEARGGSAFDKLEAVATEAEQSVAAAEDALNQITNGGS